VVAAAGSNSTALQLICQRHQDALIARMTLPIKFKDALLARLLCSATEDQKHSGCQLYSSVSTASMEPHSFITHTNAEELHQEEARGDKRLAHAANKGSHEHATAAMLTHH
jgi:hypothetical protein